ncbi:CsiV family protein [Pseudocolwellia sp. HL-MZ7]|uniref:CsiV family protein n=1 Tax=Pseudocolwellia sp. HL-MZ7 TaxID=3400627 RepID=UPI003CF5CE9D
MIRNLLKKTSFIALFPAITLSLNVNAARNYENTWFEIEVILFSQIDDKSRLQEAFPESSELPKPISVIDLLGPYLASDISTLKNRLPTCEGFINTPASPFITSNFTIQSSNYEEKVIQAKDHNFNLFDNSELTLFSNAELGAGLVGLTENSIGRQEVYSSTFISNSYQNNENNTAIDAELVQAIESSYQHNQPLTQVNIPQELCKIPEAFFVEYKKENPNFYYNGTEPNNIPELITGEEDLTTDHPYLISEESLQLQDIFQQLKRSRNFRPLLHMGWRQITKGPKDAIPLKLYAGENLIQPYNQALSNYKRANLNALAIQQNNQLFTEQGAYSSLNDINNISSNTTININSQIQEEALQEQIANILKQAKNTQPDIKSVLAELSSDPNDLVNPVTNSLVTGDELTSEQQLIEPQKPSQDWTIEGLLKVEVEHFLHITADFNVINMSLAEQATNQLITKQPVKLKSIRLEQNKRVRSKEIHYFDHPYMGMIIQIRRHDQIAPVEESEDEQLIESLD